MVLGQASATLLQRIDVALASALRNQTERHLLPADGQIRGATDLLIQGVAERDLPTSLGRARATAPHSGVALTINSFVPWQRAKEQLPLADRVGFAAVQFDVRCPTGLRGTPPHIDLLALRDDHAVAVIVRSVEYLTRQRSSIAIAYDEHLAETAGLEPWHAHLLDWRARRVAYRHVDLASLVKYATALGRTFPDRSATLLYLFWEPLDAVAYDEFGHHRQELQTLEAAVRGARVEFGAKSFEQLWQDWSGRSSPSWLGDHVARLRSRYAVSLDAAH